ncbi:hypothetical protein [Curtobacterium sp. 9128]|uniref:hypothetical protein n=1 Tax=Curtobacterium sp. 9128 TaxID=1793722 RepID=UPI0011A0689B|nr:hypothetical protein [Curtobacterium sp. 9128]
MDIDTLADDARALLLQPPVDFVRERTARQRERREDDRELATAIGAIRKPAPAAWVVDLLAHDGALDEAVEMGPALRQAQADADPREIATLRRRRSSVVRALVQAGAALAEDAGHPVTPTVLDQVRATIEAAMADPHAGAAARSGLLVRPLESAGFDDVDLDGALAVQDAVPDAWSGSDAPPIPIERARRPRKPSRASRPDPTAADRTAADPATAADQADSEPAPAADPPAARRAARQAETTARTESRDADAALDAATSELEAAEERRADRQHTVERLRAELERAATDLEDATAHLERLERVRDDAETASDRAREVLAAAQQHRRSLGR